MAPESLSMKPLRLILAATCAALALGACGGSGGAATEDQSDPGTGAASGAASVAIANFAFDPDPVTVAVGEEVTWINEDDILHTVTSGAPKEQGIPGVSKDKAPKPDGLFDEELDLDDDYSFTFDKAGEYSYFCDIHAGMEGTVVVTG